MTPLSVLGEDEKLFQDEIEKFAREVIGPKVLEMDEKELMERDIIDSLFEMGLMGIEIPEQFGGAGCNFFMSILAIEALAKVDPSVSVCSDVQNTLVNNIFLNYASEEQKAKYLPQLATKKVGCYCLTEPGSGSDAFALKTKAEDKGDHYVLEGQ